MARDAKRKQSNKELALMRENVALRRVNNESRNQMVNAARELLRANGQIQMLSTALAAANEKLLTLESEEVVNV